MAKEEDEKRVVWFVQPLSCSCLLTAQTIAVLAPPRPWRRRRRGFVAATLVTIHHNGPRSAINDERIGGGGGFGLISQHNNQLMEATQTLYPLGKEEEEKGNGYVRIVLFVLRRCNYDVWFGTNATIYPLGSGDTNNLLV